jgi:hypothetical protein
VRVERVGLEDDPDVAVARLDRVDRPAVEADLALARRVDAGEQEQRRRLAAAGGAEEGDELAVRDREAHAVDRDDLAPALAHPLKLDPCHRHLSP